MCSRAIAQDDREGDMIAIPENDVEKGKHGFCKTLGR